MEEAKRVLRGSEEFVKLCVLARLLPNHGDEERFEFDAKEVKSLARMSGRWIYQEIQARTQTQIFWNHETGELEVKNHEQNA